MSTTDNTPKTPQQTLTIEPAPETPTATNETEETRPLSELINERATEDESSLKGNFRLSNIIAGEMFNAGILRKQIGIILLVVFFIIVNISNRYGCEQRLIKIDQLEKKIQDMKYRTLSNKSRLTQECRQGNVVQKLAESHNTELHAPDQPPYEVYIPE